MNISQGLPQRSSHIEPSARPRHELRPSRKPLPRARHSWSHGLDACSKKRSFAALRPSVSALCLATPGAIKVDDGPAPQMITFPTHHGINQRFGDPTLWPPKVTSKLVAVVYKFCGIPIIREAGKTYSIQDAARVIKHVLRGVKQLVTLEQMSALRVFAANIYVPDATARADVLAELSK